MCAYASPRTSRISNPFLMPSRPLKNAGCLLWDRLSSRSDGLESPSHRFLNSPLVRDSVISRRLRQNAATQNPRTLRPKHGTEPRNAAADPVAGGLHRIPP